jgi:hypothetical protein
MLPDARVVSSYTSIRRALLVSVVAASVSLWAVGCGDSVTETEDDDTVTNECGTYDPDNDMHGLGPANPTAANLVAACDDLCAEMATVQGCSTDAIACRDECRLRTCHICPGTLVPLTECRTQFFDAAACTCADGKVTCELPTECEDEESKTGQCGG